MDKEMADKINEIFNNIVEKETGLTLAQLNLIEKLIYSKKNKKLVAIKNDIHSQHVCCTIVTNVVLNSVLKEFRERLEKAFPELEIEII